MKLALSENKCSPDCLKCVNSDKGCLLCIPGYKLIGNKCYSPKLMYLNTLSEDTSKGTIILKTIDSNNYNLSKMNQLTLTITIKIMNFPKISSNNFDCHDIIILTKDSGRRICYLSTDDSLNLMESGSPAFKFINFSKYFGEFIVISLALNSKYLYNEKSYTYDVDPSVGKYWRNYYAFYINETPVPAYREFDYENKINNLPLFINRLELGNKVWAYLKDINVYNGFYTNPFSLVTHNKIREHLIKKYSFFTSISENKKILKAPSPNNTPYQFCLDDSNIDFSAYNGINNNFAYTYKYYCVADFEIKFEKACSGNTYYELNSATIKCSPCSLSCPHECSFKGINGCTANNLDKTVFHKYTNYDSSILLSSTADINNDYYFSNDIESRKRSLQDMSEYLSIQLGQLKVATNQQYTTEFWFYLYQHGLGSITKSTVYKPMEFGSQEIIWDNHNKIIIENVDNEILVTCYPLFNNIEPQNLLYIKANQEFEKYKITRKMSDLIYKKSNWAYINCSTDLIAGKASFNDKQIDIKINIGMESDNPFNYLYKIKNKTLTDSSLIIKYGKNSKTNYGLLYFEEMRLWNKSIIDEKSPECL